VTRRRIDTLLAERGLAGSRTSAAESVRAGRVRIGRDGPLAVKPGQLVADDAELLVVEQPRFVSRGGIKLENALESVGIDVAGLDCLDVGASTGGFTDCLLKRGAARVAALDVAHGQLDWGLRNDRRVTTLERANARDLRRSDLPFAPALTTVDVSFISATKLLPALGETLDEGADVLVMVKPQFELARERVGKGGVVRDAADRRDALARVVGAASREGFGLLGMASSGLPGPKGNRETFAWLRRGVADEVDAQQEFKRVEP
jgi:23S rRNA (cytidine1920-2'-O)/16S rRNA (cytidine1409-2'-O)-methyltransferase